MKNPLVDALREAQTDAPEKSDAKPDGSSDDAIDLTSDVSATELDAPTDLDLPTDGQTTARDTANELGDAEFDLLTTGSFSPAPADESSSIVDPNVAPAHEFDDKTAIETSDVMEITLPSSDGANPSLRVNESDPIDPATSPTDESDAQGPAFDRRSPLIPKLGRLSPLFCLVALSASAGGYYFVNIVSANSLNEDLNGIARLMQNSAPRPSDEIQNRTSTEFGIPAMANAGIETRADSLHQAVTVRGTQSGAVGSTQATTVDDTARVTASNSTGDHSNVRISSSAADVGRFRDRAHSFVMDAYAAYQVKDYALAESGYLRALEAEPHHVDALAGIAAVYLQTNRIAAALAGYEKLLSVDASSAIASSAILSIHAGDPAWDSESELKLLLQRFPGAHQLHYALGSVFVGENRWPDARQSFLAAHRLAPDNANYSYNAAVSMEKVGDHDAARFYYETALEAAGQDSNIDRSAVIAHLNSLNAGRRGQ